MEYNKVMFTMSIDQHFVSLRNVSDNVDDYLGRELYKEDLLVDKDCGDTFSPRDILSACYGIVLEELKDFGIMFNIPDDDILADMVTCGYVYLIRKLVSPRELSDYISSLQLTDTVYTYITSDETNMTVFRDLVELFTAHTNNPEIQELLYMTESVYNNKEFISYIKNIVDNIQNNKYADVIPDVNLVTKYIKQVQMNRKLIEEYALSVASHYEDTYTINYDLLHKLIKEYDYDKLSPEEIRYYAIVDTEDEINPRWIPTKTRLLDAHHLRISHHIEFWLSTDNGPKPNFSIEYLIMLMVHFVEPGVDADEYREKADDMLSAAATFLGEEYLSLSRQMEKFIIDLLDNTVEEF
jgi:hypothetical protein